MSAPLQFNLWLGNESAGPFSPRQIRDMQKDGAAQGSTLACRVGFDQWMPIEDHPLLQTAEISIKKPGATDAAQVSLPQADNKWGAEVVLVAIGFALMLWGFLTNISRPLPGVDTGWKTDAPAQVNNIGLISDRESRILFGGFLFLGGCLMRGRCGSMPKLH